MPKHTMRLVLICTLGPIANAGEVAWAAQQGDEDSREVRIIVTGERVSREVEQTASSVAVISAAELEARPDIDRFDQLLDAIPNVTFGSGGQGPTIRGQDTNGVLRDLPAFLGGNRQRATMVVDGRASSYFEFVFGAQPLWDVERIEVFRSPQTTTQGRNSIAGGIFVETRAPEWEWGGAFRAIAGNYDTRQVSGMVTGPLYDDQLAIRIAGDVRGSRTSTKLTSEMQGIDPNRDEFELLRVKLLAAPEAVSGLTLDATFQATGSQSPQIEGIRAPFLERSDPRANYGTFRNSSEATTIRPRLDLGEAGRLAAVVSIGSARARRFAPPGFGEAENLVADRAAELVYTRAAGKLAILAGTAASISRLKQDINLTRVGLGIGAFRDKQESFGLFGELRFEALPSLALVAGMRYQFDRQERTGELSTASGVLPLEYLGRYEAWLPKFSISYEAGDEATVGVLVQRAGNPGGTTLAIPSGRLDRFDEEHLWDFELFLRGRLPGAGLSYAANMFRYDIRDGQRSVVTAIASPGGTIFVQEIGNVRRSWSKGAEIELGWKPSARLRLSLAGALLDTRITEAPDDRDPLLGKQFQRAPHFTGAASLGWMPATNVSFQLQYTRRSGHFSNDANTPQVRVGSADNLNVRVGWEFGPVRLFGFVRNAFDSFDLTSIFDNGNLATASDPREFGAGVETRF